MNKQRSFREFITFGIIGGINTVLSLVIYWICINVFGIYYVIANIIGWIITVAISYVLNNIFTFNNGSSREWSLKALCKAYMSYALTGLIISNLLLVLWVDVLNINENIAPLINLVVTVPINFIINKLWVYKRK